MNVWYVNSILGTFRLEEENDAICGLTLCPDGVPELEPLPRKVCETPLLQEAEEQLNEYFAGARREFDLPLQPHRHPSALPPGGGQHRQAHRLRLWRGDEAIFAGVGTAGVIL